MTKALIALLIPLCLFLAAALVLLARILYLITQGTPGDADLVVSSRVQRPWRTILMLCIGLVIAALGITGFVLELPKYGICIFR